MRILFVLCGVFGLLFASASKTDAGGVAFASAGVGVQPAFAFSAVPAVGAFGCPVQSSAFVPAFGFQPSFGFRQQVFLPAFSPFAFRTRVGFAPAFGGAQAFAGVGGFANARAAASVGGGAFFGRRSRAVAVTRTGLFGRQISRARAVSR